MARGGWYKMFDDELEDAKVARLTDWEYRVWHACLSFCNRSPARLRERGWLFHSPGFPVTVHDFMRALGRRQEEINAALRRICRIGGGASLLLVDSLDGCHAYRVRAWRKRQRPVREKEVFPDSSQDEQGEDATGAKQDAPAELGVPKTSPNSPTLSPPYVIRRRKTRDENLEPPSGKARAKTARAAKSSLSEEQQTSRGEVLGHYRNRLSKHTGAAKPEFPEGQAAAFIGRRLRVGDTEADLIATIDLFFDEWIRPEGAGNWGHYQRAFNALIGRHPQAIDRAQLAKDEAQTAELTRMRTPKGAKP